MNIPEAGRVRRLAPGLRCVLAPNPSPMTLHGTNTYILGEGAVAVIDPGPDLPAHLAAIEAALERGERVSHVLVTHSHRDHSPLAHQLARRHGAAVFGFGNAEDGRSAVMQALAARGGMGGGEGVDAGFQPDERLPDDAVLDGQGWSLRAIRTPGHMGNHLCFEWDGMVFSGDHVMGWASSLISPPDGDMGAYMDSLARLDRLGARRLLPGHGAPVEDPAARIAQLAAHRKAREAAIRATLGPAPASIDAITQTVYTDTPAGLMPAARRNVLAHLIDLTERGLALPEGELGPHTAFLRP